jgi:cytochrome c-type biogenesis protein CcmH/NrfF
MSRVRIAFAFAFLALAPSAHARFGDEDPRLERLFSTFISPFCWRENLTVHDSEIAYQLRDRIRAMVLDGWTDNQIKAVLVKQYTRQILALPDGPQGMWLFLTPWLATAAGALGVLFLLHRLRTHAAAPAMADLTPAELEWGWDRD